MKKLLTLSILPFLVCCKQQTVKDSDNGNGDAVIQDTVIIAPLDSGNVFYKNKEPFGEIIELKGTHIEGDTFIFKVQGSQMLVRDNKLVYGSHWGDKPFIIFDLPSLMFEKHAKGTKGQGPDEFMYPTLVPTTDTTILCYAFEMTNQKLYKLYASGEMSYFPFNLSPAAQSKSSDKQIVNVASDDFMYVETSKTGKSIFRTTKVGDSIVTREIYNLGLNPKRKSWANYIGDFAVNPQKDRMVYAYKYLKIIKFMDMEARTVKTIDFERGEFDEGTLRVADGMDQNVTHYWGVSAGKDFVYFLYSGRTPPQVMNENNKQIFYIFLEQYDWNGNPVRKFKLDRWGYFTVDEENKKIYLASTNDDDPFFVFQLE
ncbi:MAG: TolB-like 6-bladed beta-propeller domain-containing protein [Tannerella sp.]|jgi:hypothetical protein|nr:TolB-like 6-bladed beta-propeller domain-containing protein [Tannerella sp.]